MGTVRFSTVQDLYDAYETAQDDVGKPPSDTGSLDFLRTLSAAREWNPAISFCAYLLPRRIAVAWGCRSLRRALPRNVVEQDKALAFAEAWVAEPEELQRRKVLALGNQSDTRAATTWLALAAGWSGGSVVPPESGYVAARAEQTARAIRVALMITVSRLPDGAASTIVPAWLEDGMQLASGEPASS